MKLRAGCAGDESGDEGSGPVIPDLSNMVNLMRDKEAEVAAGKARLEEAAKKLEEAEGKLKVGGGSRGGGRH